MGYGLRSTLWIIAALVLFDSAALAGGDGRTVYQRFAVIGSPALQKSGLTVLVSDELLQAGVGLVEREELKAIIGEQTLDASVASDGVGERRRIGALVKADALALLRDEGTGAERSVHLIVAESSQGARLSSDYFALKTPTAELAHAIAMQIVRTRTRFAGGLKAMVGVPPFIARNFTYEYQVMQRGYAVLLQDALCSAPGVAVVEIEEARAIGREQETSGQEANGIVPVFVEGEFDVATTPNRPPLVRFHVLLRRKGQSRIVDRIGLSLQEATGWVSRDLAREVLPEIRESLVRPFSPAEEIVNLSARADAFAALGEWRHAADLRQAALVIRPDDAEQRDRLLKECRSAVESLRVSPLYRKGTPQWEELAAGALDSYRDLLECAEWKIRRHPSHPDEKPVAGDVALSIIWMQGSHAADLAQPLKRDFLLHVYPLTWDQKWNQPQAGDALDHRAAWFDMLLSIAFSCNGQPLVREDYDLLLSILNDMAPEGIAPSPRLTGLLWGRVSSQEKARSNAAFQDFLQQLRDSNRPLNRVLAREAMLALQVRRAPGPKWAEEAERIRGDFVRLNLPSSKAYAAGVMEELDRIEGKRPQTETALAANVDSGGEPEAPAEMGRLRLGHLSFRSRGSNGEFVAAAAPGRANLLQCSDGLDVMWDEGAIYFMREPGIVEMNFSRAASASTFNDVQWDGQSMWVGTLGDGIWVVDGAGTIIAKIGAAEGLPPCDRGLRMLALGPNRLMIAGSFGAAARGFLAMLEKTDGKYHVRVFHQAVGVVEQGVSGEKSFAADLAFVPAQMARCRSRDGGDFVVIRRSFSTLGAERRPLIVDLKTLKTAASDVELSQHPFLPVAGGILQGTMRLEEYALWRPSADGRALLQEGPTVRLPEDRIDPIRGASNPLWAVGGDGMVYLPGSPWFGVDPRTMTAKRLSSGGVKAGLLQNIAWSHWGLIYWGAISGKGSSMYRVRLDEIAPQTSSAVVPPAAR